MISKLKYKMDMMEKHIVYKKSNIHQAVASWVLYDYFFSCLAIASSQMPLVYRQFDNIEIEGDSKSFQFLFALNDFS